MDRRNILIKEIEYIPEQYLDYILTFVEFIKINKIKETFDISLMSEFSLKKDWLKPEEGIKKAYPHITDDDVKACSSLTKLNINI